LSRFKDKNINFFHRSLTVMVDDADAFQELLTDLAHDDLAEVCQLYANMVRYLARDRCNQYSFDFGE